MGRMRWPEPVDAYLREVRHRLADLPAGYRDEVVSGLAEHANDRLAEGDDPAAVVAALGDPAAVARQAREEAPAAGPRRPSRRVAQATALVLAVLAAILGGAVAWNRSAWPPPGWGVLLLVVLAPILLALVPLLVRGRVWRPVAIAALVLLAGLAVWLSATVGLLLIPALLAALVALFLPDRPRRPA